MLYNIYNLIFADKARRASHVRALEIHIAGVQIPYSPSGIAERLLAILTCADRLESILIPPDASSVVSFFGGLDARILPTIGNIPTLRRLTVKEGGHEAHEFMRNVHSPLIFLHAELYPWKSDSGLYLDQLTSLTSGVATTLEVLKVDVMEFDDNSPVHAVTPLPALRSFDLHCAVMYPRLEYFLRAFPALSDTLSLGAGDEERWWDLDDRLIRQIREENQQIQNSRRWVGIDYLHCEAHNFFALGLRCPVHRADIVDCSTLTRDYVTAALQDNPPSQLRLEIDLRHGLSVFEGLFPPQLAISLTHLAVELRYACNTEVDGDEAVEGGDLTASASWNKLLVCPAPLRDNMAVADGVPV